MQNKFINFFSSSFTEKYLVDGNLLNTLVNPSNKINRLLQYSAFALLFFGFKLWVIHSYGNATPFWDQWDAEAATLYKYYFDGTLTWKHFIEHHNEHRLLTTRLLALILLILNRTWNPLLQMVVNAGLHLMVIVLFNSLLTKVIGRNNLPGLLVFSLVLFVVPFGWENTLVGFQAQFYFVILFSIAAIWLLISTDPFSFRWWGGVLLGIFAFFSLASGVFVFATGAVIGILVYVLKLRKTYKQLFSSVLLGLLFLTGAFFTPSLEHQAVYKAHSIPDFFHALKLVLGWPVGWNSLSTLIRNFPIGIFVLYILWKRPAAADSRWFLFALCVWSIGQALSIGYARALGPLSSRYKDLHVIPIFVNFACMISLAQVAVTRWRNYAILGLVAWIAIILISIGLNGFNYLPGELATKRNWNVAEEKNLKNYVATGDINYLKNKPEMDVPYPDIDKLATIIEFPGVREILPPNVSSHFKPVARESKTSEAFVINGYKQTVPKLEDSVWGSYNTNREAAIGYSALRFNTNCTNTKIEIPVAGSPLHEGMKLEIEQHGKRRPIVIKENSNDSWTSAYIKVDKGPFSVCLTDSSKTAWMAIGAPVMVSRFDKRVDNLLSHYYVFIVIGFMISLLIIILTGLKKFV
jgi:hypothetical protein